MFGKIGMIETIQLPSPQKPNPKAKVPLDICIGQVLDYLTIRLSGATIEELADTFKIPPGTVRKVLAIIAMVTSKVALLFAQNQGRKVRLLLARSPKGSVSAARFELVSPSESPEGTSDQGDAGQKPTYIMNPADVVEIQWVWKIYKATGRAFRHEEAGRLTPLFERFPYLFTQNATKTGLLPTMSLFTVAKTIDQYASLGRLPEAIETAVAIITFDGGV